MRPHDGRVVSNLIVQTLMGEPITIYGDGTQARSFCSVADEVEGLYGLFIHADNQPTNIGNPVVFTVTQLAELVVELTGTKAPIVYRELPEDDPKVRQPDITKRAGIVIGIRLLSCAKGCSGLSNIFREWFALAEPDEQAESEKSAQHHHPRARLGYGRDVGGGDLLT